MFRGKEDNAVFCVVAISYSSHCICGTFLVEMEDGQAGLAIRRTMRRVVIPGS